MPSDTDYTRQRGLRAMGTWGVAKAKARFSEVLDKAESEGPQTVKRKNRQFVLLTEEELAKRTGTTASTWSGPGSGKASWDALRCPPEDGIDIEFPRITGGLREVAF